VGGIFVVKSDGVVLIKKRRVPGPVSGIVSGFNKNNKFEIE
jgi:hypothetical protein